MGGNILNLLRFGANLSVMIVFGIFVDVRYLRGFRLSVCPSVSGPPSQVWSVGMADRNPPGHSI